MMCTCSLSEHAERSPMGWSTSGMTFWLPQAEAALAQGEEVVTDCMTSSTKSCPSSSGVAG